MYENLNKRFFSILKIFSFLSVIIYLYESYLISSVAKSEELIVTLLILLYFYGYFFYLTLISLYRKLVFLYPFSVLFAPLFPVLFYIKHLINIESPHYNLFESFYFDISYLENVLSGVNFYFITIGIHGFVKIVGVYFGLLLVNKFYTELLLDKVIRFMLGKKIPDDIFGDDFSYISIYSKEYPDNGNKLELIMDIIGNLLGYKITGHKIIKYKETEYEIIKFTRTEYYNFRRYKYNILLLPMKCIDINYLNWLDNFGVDEKPPEVVQLNNLEAVEDGVSYVNDFEASCDVLYQCYFIKQYYETEDEISHIQSVYNETYLAFANILSNKDKFINYNSDYNVIFNAKNEEEKTNKPFLCLSKSLIVYFKNDDILANEAWSLRTYLFSQCIFNNYNTLADKICSYFCDKVEAKHLKVVYLLFIALIPVFLLILIQNYTKNIMNTIIFISALLTIPYSVIGIYNWFKGRKT